MDRTRGAQRSRFYGWMAVGHPAFTGPTRLIQCPWQGGCNYLGEGCWSFLSAGLRQEVRDPLPVSLCAPWGYRYSRLHTSTQKTTSAAIAAWWRLAYVCEVFARRKSQGSRDAVVRWGRASTPALPATSIAKIDVRSKAGSRGSAISARS